MDAAAEPTPRSRFKSRNRYPPRIHSHQRHLAPQLDRPDAPPVDARRDGARATKEKMTRAHRFFHRRAAQANTKIVTVAVEVVAEVDGNGSLVAQETLAPVTLQASHDAVIPAPAAPTVPALPTVSAVPNVPAVPTVPAVPSVLAVPAIPTMPAVPSVVPAAQLPLPSAAQLPAAPVLPAVPAVPVVSAVPVPALPSVPAVPPFPDNLHVPSVPGYPFSTGIPLAQVATPSAAVPVSSIPPTGPQGTATPPVAPTPAPISAISSAGNATISSSTLLLASSSLASLDSISASTASELIATIAAAPPRSASSSASTLASVSTSASPLASQSLPSSIRTPSMQTSNSFQSTHTTATTSQPASTTAYYPGGYGGGGETPGMAPAPAATTSAAAGTNSTPSALETPKVVGSVVGSLAGAALILALILLLLQRHKRKRGGALQLTGDDHTDTNRSVTNRSMSQAPPTGSTLIPASFLHRFSGLSGKTGETNLSGGERSFQRVSGRKLPSAFSEGLTSDQFSGGGTMSGSSFYQDDQGTYGGPGASKDFGKEIGKEVGIPTITRESGQMNIRPSPARTPIIKHPDDGNPFASDQDFLSPPQSPNPELPARGSLGRSLHSADGSRSSRFTENV